MLRTKLSYKKIINAKSIDEIKIKSSLLEKGYKAFFKEKQRSQTDSVRSVIVGVQGSV